jgi:succinyl-CoA synthetase beta subunit
MARLHEYQGKAILAANGFKIPRGRATSSANEAVAAAKELGAEVVIKIQAWATGRAGIGGVVFAKKPEDVRVHTERMLSMKVGQFPVEAVLVEEKIDIDREFFLSLAIDDAARAPMIIFAAGGGTARRVKPADSVRCESRAVRFSSQSSCRFVWTFACRCDSTRGFDPKIVQRGTQRRSAFA